MKITCNEKFGKRSSGRERDRDRMRESYTGANHWVLFVEEGSCVCVCVCLCVLRFLLTRSGSVEQSEHRRKTRDREIDLRDG